MNFENYFTFKVTAVFFDLVIKSVKNDNFDCTSKNLSNFGTIKTEWPVDVINFGQFEFPCCYQNNLLLILIELSNR